MAKSQHSSNVSPDSSASTEDDLITITHHEGYLRDGGKRLMMCAVTLLLLGALQVFMIFMWIMTPPIKAHFRGFEDFNPPAGQKLQTKDVTLFKPPPLNQPALTKEQVMIFANSIASSVYSFNFFNYKEHFEDVKANFTEAGWAGFSKALDDSKIVDAVRKNYYIVSARTVAPPVLLKHGVLQGAYLWQVRFPLFITYKSSKWEASQRLTVQMNVTRVPLSDTHPMGLAVANFVITKVQQLF